MPSLSTSFTPEDYALWNETTCLFTLTKRIVGSDSSTKVRAEFIKVLGPGRVSGVQILPGYQFRVELKTVRDRQSLELRGLDFRGVHLTPRPAYEVFHQVFVDQVPFQVPNEAFKIDLGLYGRVVAVKHLPVKGFPQIQSGTRMVTMTVKTPVPRYIKVAGFSCVAGYKGQPVTCNRCDTAGHKEKQCPLRTGKKSFAGAVRDRTSGPPPATRSTTGTTTVSKESRRKQAPPAAKTTLATPAASEKGTSSPTPSRGKGKQAPAPQAHTNNSGRTQNVARSLTTTETGKGARWSPSSSEEGGRVSDASRFLEKVAPLPTAATGVLKKGGRRSSFGLPLPTTKSLTHSRRSVTIARRRPASCRHSTAAKRVRSSAWPARSVLPGRKGLLRILCGKNRTPPPTPTTTTPVVISEAPAVRSICGPAKALAITVHPHNREEDHSAQTLDLPPASSTTDSTPAVMSDAQAGLDKALVLYTGPPEAEGSASASVIKDGSARGLDLPPTSAVTDLTLAEMADAHLVPPLPESDSEDDLRGNNIIDVPLGDSQALDVSMTRAPTPVNPGTPTPEIQSFSDSGPEGMEIGSFSPSDGAVNPQATAAVVAQVANVVAADHISQFTASEEGLVVVHTASRVVEQTTIVATQQESEDVIPPTPGVTGTIQRTVVQSAVGSMMALPPVVQRCSLVDGGPDSLGSTPNWQPSALALPPACQRSESEASNLQLTYDGCSDQYLSSDEEYASASESSDDDKTLAIPAKSAESTALVTLRRRVCRGPRSEPLPLPPPELSPVMVVSSDEEENHS